MPLIASLLPVPPDWRGSAQAVADYAWRAAADPSAPLGQVALASICEALESACQDRYEASARAVESEQMGALLRALVVEETAFWRPILGRITLTAYEGALYGEGDGREGFWRALEHPWSRGQNRDRGESST